MAKRKNQSPISKKCERLLDDVCDIVGGVKVDLEDISDDIARSSEEIDIAHNRLEEAINTSKDYLSKRFVEITKTLQLISEEMGLVKGWVKAKNVLPDNKTKCLITTKSRNRTHTYPAMTEYRNNVGFVTCDELQTTVQNVVAWRPWPEAASFQK